ncbi:hypothetical protein BaRGS_00032243 [Batillaria attramentaria]|uniref:U8 snoRNA-decapping enzyme n=1 Tax=Batillaria attramentaria TaxID=370345 RepID=A0ABD0JN97_9CAEN
MADIGWGWLSQVEAFGRLGDDAKDFVQIDYEESMTKFADYKHAAHGMIFARSGRVLWDIYKLKGAVMMQMRFDGVLGFPGGLVEAGEDPADGLNREMQEEIGLNVEVHKFTAAHHVQTCLNEKKKLLTHFFAMEVTLEKFSALEANVLQAPEYGIETFGIVRVPLFTMGDGLRGLPAFLTNQFAGNARTQLLFGLQYMQLLTAEELQEVVQSSNKYLAQKQGMLRSDL